MIDATTGTIVVAVAGIGMAAFPTLADKYLEWKRMNQVKAIIENAMDYDFARDMVEHRNEKKGGT